MKSMKILIIGMFILLTIPFVCAQESPNGTKYMQLYETANRQGDNTKALEYLELAVKNNNGEGLSRLGEAYLHGTYGLNDPQKAFELIKKSATTGNRRGMTNLGIIYMNGSGTKVNYKKAFSWFEKAYKSGDMKAPRYMGLLFEKGLGRKVDFEKAAYYYQKGADKGDITSQYYLGHLYEKGLGVKQDYKKAFELYQESGARGDIISLPAMMALGNMYENGLGLDKSITEAMKWYSKCSSLGDTLAKSKIAIYNYPDYPNIMNITAIVKVLGDGQKVSAIAIQYKDSIDKKSLNIADYKVPGREISSVYVNNEGSVSSSPKDGDFVIVELKTTIDKESSNMGGGPQKSEGGASSSPTTNSGDKGKPAGFSGPKLGEVSDKSPIPVTLTAQITQCGEVSTKGGRIFAASDKVLTSNNTISPDVKDFKQFVFHDSIYNKDLMYNLYVPADYDSSKKYPLVLFMHDAGVVSNNPIETLTQGLGAVVWASKEDQAKHACFVLAPQYNKVIVGDGASYTDELDMTIDLIKSLMKQYGIDENRLYNTGQSMGGMTSIAMDIKYPDFFAASFLVACQWTPELVKPMAHKALWIVVSQGDNKANPGMDSITSVLKSAGSTVAKAVWNAEADQKTLQNDVDAMLSQNATINYTVFTGGNHRYTWQYAYSIDGIRDWLLKQHK